MPLLDPQWRRAQHRKEPGWCRVISSTYLKADPYLKVMSEPPKYVLYSLLSYREAATKLPTLPILAQSFSIRFQKQP